MFKFENHLDSINYENHLGEISLKNNYLTTLIGHTVTSCFGVVEMNPFGAKQGVRKLFGDTDYIDNGVLIRKNQEKIIVDLHIKVLYGVNVSAIVDSIINKVQFVLAEEAGIIVSKINVFIDGMKS